MEFNEPSYVDMTQSPKVFVYFLLQNKEVIYVGQTKKGMARVYAHEDKQFTNVYIIETSPDTLDYLEDIYIKKYKPKYNKKLNATQNYTYSRVVKEINSNWVKSCSVPCKTFTRRKLDNIVKELGIVPFVYEGLLYITKADFLTIDNGIEEYLMGRNNNEIFNLRV